jgi:hypothetical protein
MLKGCLVFSSMCLGVPFIAPRQLGAVESIPGRHCPVRISFLIWRSRPLALWSRWRTGHCPVHTGQSGALLPTVGSATCPARIARSTVGPADHWPGRPLAHRTVRCTPDSPVNYSRTPLITSREQQVLLSQPGTPDTVRCTTGQSGAPRQS